MYAYHLLVDTQRASSSWCCTALYPLHVYIQYGPEWRPLPVQQNTSP